MATDITCPRCTGSGSLKQVCGSCRGKGCKVCSGGTVWVTCTLCHGRGKIDG
jgi:DnaJ-class molecular chaperone